MYWIERMLVDEEYVARKDTYNLKLGGCGGFDHINTFDFAYYEQQKMLNKRSQISQRILYSDECWVSKKNLNISIGLKNAYKNGIKISTGFPESAAINAQSDDAKRKRKETYKKIGFQQGEKNSQFGKIWIHHLRLKFSFITSKDLIFEYILEGFILGTHKIPCEFCGREISFKNIKLHKC